MTRARNKLPLVSAFLALMLGLLVLGPVGDALACGPDLAQPAAAVLIEVDPPHSDLDACPPSHCAHGHCHAQASLPPQTLGAYPALSAPIVSDPPPEAGHTSTAPDGLIRPPRA